MVVFIVERLNMQLIVLPFEVITELALIDKVPSPFASEFIWKDPLVESVTFPATVKLYADAGTVPVLVFIVIVPA